MTIKNIDAKTLENWLEKNEAVLVDVRESKEHVAQKICGSTLLPLAQISQEKLPNYKNKKLVLHCHAGRRSMAACEKLLQQNSDLEIYNLEGGILSWSNSGCKIISSEKFFLPLDRQVQLTIGIGVLSGSLLAYFFNINFIFLAAFFGAGLIFAAISGFCGLATLMAKMPWN